jgi:hypothetical protein
MQPTGLCSEYQVVITAALVSSLPATPCVAII